MGFLSLFEEKYQLFGFGSDLQALSADQILQMQLRNQVAMQQGIWPLSYLQGLAQYQPPQRPLDERFSDFKLRLAAAVERHSRKH